MGFEPMTLHDLVGCSNHWATGDSTVSKGEMWVFVVVVLHKQNLKDLKVMTLKQNKNVTILLIHFSKLFINLLVCSNI